MRGSRRAGFGGIRQSAYLTEKAIPRGGA